MIKYAIIPLLLLLIPIAYAEETELPVISLTTFEGITLDGARTNHTITNIHANNMADGTISITGEIINRDPVRDFRHFEIQAIFYSDRDLANEIITEIITIEQLVSFEETFAWNHTTSIINGQVLGAQFTAIMQATVIDPTVNISLQDSAQGNIVNIIGDNFGENKEILISVIDPTGLVLENMTQYTTSQGRINVLFQLSDAAISGTYSIYLTNHSFETTLTVDYLNDSIEVVETITEGDPEEKLTPQPEIIVEEPPSSSTPSEPIIPTSNNWEQFILDLDANDRIELVRALFQYLLS